MGLSISLSRVSDWVTKTISGSVGSFSTKPRISGISDTSKWIAYYRFLEQYQKYPLFRDPLAKVLAGPDAEIIARVLDPGLRIQWIFAIRTYLLDKMILECLQAEQIDTVINLACGLDSRPYRLDLPSDLHWIEVDLPPLIEHKKEVLTNEAPKCRISSIALDLSDVTARRDFFRTVDRTSKKALIIAEGILVYLTPEMIQQLAEDLFGCSSVTSWLVNLNLPLGTWGQRNVRKVEKAFDASTRFRFYPKEGAGFFRPFGWVEKKMASIYHTAFQLGRMPWYYVPLHWIFVVLFPGTTVGRGLMLTGVYWFKKANK